MGAARITVFAGHYGSGKTTLAVCHALRLAEQGLRVTLCDLDIVNPYFRTADAAELLSSRGVRLVASPFANTNVDAPALPAATRAIFDDPGITAVIDLGGDDRGALALGRYAKALTEPGVCEMLLVINPFRPLTRTPEEVAEVRREMEAAGRVPFTGLLHNANLGRATTLQDVISTLPFAEEASRATGLPLKTIGIMNTLLPPRGSLERNLLEKTAEIFPIHPIEKTIWRL
jgi:hypothetical protein